MARRPDEVIPTRCPDRFLFFRFVKKVPLLHLGEHVEVKIHHLVADCFIGQQCRWGRAVTSCTLIKPLLFTVQRRYNEFSHVQYMHIVRDTPVWVRV